MVWYFSQISPKNMIKYLLLLTLPIISNAHNPELKEKCDFESLKGEWYGDFTFYTGTLGLPLPPSPLACPLPAPPRAPPRAAESRAFASPGGATRREECWIMRCFSR